jgi:hypothetical protein
LRRRVLLSPRLPELKSGNQIIDDWVARQLQPFVTQVFEQVSYLLRDPSFIAPTFQNDWVDYDAGYELTGYYKDPRGFVHLRGLVKDGTLNTTIFTLPVGYRPSNALLFVTVGREGATNSVNRITIDTSGNLTQEESASNDWLSLNGIYFLADAP